MLLKKVQKGQLITADMINNIIDSVRECQIQSGVGYSFNRSAGGTTLCINLPKPKIQNPTICPFEPKATPATGGYEVSFSAGTINGIVPTNMFEKFTNVSTAQRNFFYLKCDSDGKLITTALIEKDTNLRTPQAATIDSAPDSLQVLIATMATSGEISRTIPCDNISAQIYPTIQIDNNTFVAGERNYKQYYNWLT